MKATVLNSKKYLSLDSEGYQVIMFSDCAKLKAGNNSILIGGNWSILIGGYVLIANSKSFYKSGAGSIQICKYFDGEKITSKCQLITELEADKWFTCDDNWRLATEEEIFEIEGQVCINLQK